MRTAAFLLCSFDTCSKSAGAAALVRELNLAAQIA